MKREESNFVARLRKWIVRKDPNGQLLVLTNETALAIKMSAYFDPSPTHLKLAVILQIRKDESSWQQWRECVTHNPAHISIDLYKVGILLDREGISRQHFNIRIPLGWLRPSYPWGVGESNSLSS